MASELDLLKRCIVLEKLQELLQALSKTTREVCPCISSSILYGYPLFPCKKHEIAHRSPC